jgi:hypothetical protein
MVYCEPPWAYFSEEEELPEYISELSATWIITRQASIYPLAIDLAT